VQTVQGPHPLGRRGLPRLVPLLLVDWLCSHATGVHTGAGYSLTCIVSCSPRAWLFFPFGSCIKRRGLPVLIVVQFLCFFRFLFVLSPHRSWPSIKNTIYFLILACSSPRLVYFHPEEPRFSSRMGVYLFSALLACTTYSPRNLLACFSRSPSLL
jgi:hypothetical protein